MRALSITATLVLVLPGCKGEQAPPSEIAPQQQAQDGAPAQQERVLAAAGIALTFPDTWTIAEDRDPDFGLALGPGDDPVTCTIELRRQGLGELPRGARARGTDEFDFSRAMLRGRVRTLPGPTEDSSVVIQCLAPRSAQWSAIEAAFESQASAPIEPRASSPTPGPIAQLCTGTLAHPTYVCVRRSDGAVYCGVSDGDVLARIPGIEPSAQLACEGARACSRGRDSGALSCWKADTEPTILPQFAKARDLAGGCLVDAAGKVACRERESNGLTAESFAELVPFGDPKFALEGVQQVLAGSSASQGCVLGADGLRCWDRTSSLKLALADSHQPHTLEVPQPAGDLALIGGRVCTGGPDGWTCLDGDQRLQLDDCERRACGCSLLGAMQLSCDIDPMKVGVPLLGRISDVTSVDGACAALADGTVVCRGPAPGRAGDSPRVRELVASGRPGVLHVLELREPND